MGLLQQLTQASPQVQNQALGQYQANRAANAGRWTDLFNQLPQGTTLTVGDQVQAAQQMGQNAAADILDLAPQFASQQMQELNTYAPQQADLFMRLINEYMPQHAQARLDLETQFAPQLADLYRGIMRGDQQAYAQTAQDLAGGIRDTRRAVEGADATALTDSLMGLARRELDAGERLTPEAERQASQAARASMEARGINGGMGASGREAVARALAGRDLLERRTQMAQGILGQEQGQANRYNPFDIVAQASTAPTAMASAGATTPMSGVPGQGNPVSGIQGAAGAVGTGYGVSQNQNATFLNSEQAANQQYSQNLATMLGFLQAMNTGGISGRQGNTIRNLLGGL